MTRFAKYLGLIILSATMLAITGCGGSSGGGSAQTGQVSVVFTDGPTDEYEQILITLTRMTLIGAGGQVVIYDGGPITFDLLQLRDRADFAFSQRVTVGEYNKIRLEVAEVTLVDLGDVADPTDDVEVVLDKLPANGKIDLNPRGPISILADRATVVELDMDARRSFQVVNTGNGGLRLRPVIFVNVYDDEIVLPNRITRVFGTVESVDVDASSLVLCDLQFVAQLGGLPAPNDGACVQVFAAGASAFDAAGMAVEFATLAADIDNTPEAQLTAIGFPTLPATTADSIVLELDAVTTELGPRKTDSEPGWETTPGTIVSDLTMDNCDAAQCVDFLPAAEATALTVQLQPETRVFTRDGTELSQADLGADVAGTFDGLRVAVSDAEQLLASLFITGPDAGGDLVSGTLTAVMTGDTFDTLVVQPESGPALNVCVTSDTDMLQILVDNETVTIVDLLDPAVLDPSTGLQVEAAGTSPGMEAGCDLDASVVIID